MKHRVQNPEVLYAVDGLTVTRQADIEYLKRLAAANPGKRVRLCTHLGVDEALHEMLIVHERDAYVRPHRHPTKTESMHVIEGEADLVIFTLDGEVDRVVRMSPYGLGAAFYQRMAVPLFHMLLIRSDVLVFHETTNGPFDPSATLFAPWAPVASDTIAVRAYVADVERRVAAHLANGDGE